MPSAFSDYLYADEDIMRRSRESRWKEGRNTLPARRRRRRAHRRDLPASRHYIPMEIDPQIVVCGVKVRFLSALIAILITLGSIIWGVSVATASVSASFAFIVGFISLGAATALLMSARREEEVHELASELNDPQFIAYLNPQEHDGSI